MFKYLKYLFICVFKLISKTPIGWIMFHLVRPFRKYARNTIYNYILQNNIYLKRLIERKPFLANGLYYLENRNKSHNQGIIKYKKVSKINYYLTLWFIWIWIDDDSNYDTTDLFFAQKVSQGLHFSWLPKFIKNRVSIEVEQIKNSQFGKAFDLGDNRNKDFFLISSTLWNIRNTAYNFVYMFEECLPEDKNFFYFRFDKLGWHFGYLPDGYTKGRLVFFSEDYEKVDNA